MSNQTKVNSKALNGIYGFYRNKNYGRSLDRIDKKGIHNIIRSYCEEEHEFEGSLTECAELVQDNFDSFVKYSTHNF